MCTRITHHRPKGATAYFAPVGGLDDRRRQRLSVQDVKRFRRERRHLSPCSAYFALSHLQHPLWSPFCLLRLTSFQTLLQRQPFLFLFLHLEKSPAAATYRAFFFSTPFFFSLGRREQCIRWSFALSCVAFSCSLCFSITGI